MFWKINILSVNISTKLFLPTIFNNLFTLSTDSHTYNTRCFNLGCLMVPPPPLYFLSIISKCKKEERKLFVVPQSVLLYFCTTLLQYDYIYLLYIFLLIQVLLQSWRKYVRQTLVLMWNSAVQQNFNFSFSAVTASIKKTFGLGGRLCTSL